MYNTKKHRRNPNMNPIIFLLLVVVELVVGKTVNISKTTTTILASIVLDRGTTPSSFDVYCQEEWLQNHCRVGSARL